MIVYIVRHAIAFERDAERWPDDAKRPLTDKGTAKFEKVAERLPALEVTVDVCFTSPLVRAVQTAAILHTHAQWPKAKLLEALRPEGEPAEVIGALAKESVDTIAVIGHEPSLSDLLACMLLGEDADPLGSMKKGGIACVEFTGKVSPGAGVLRWLTTPKLMID